MTEDMSNIYSKVALSVLSYYNENAQFQESIMLLCKIAVLHMTFASSIIIQSYFYDIQDVSHNETYVDCVMSRHLLY